MCVSVCLWEVWEEFRRILVECLRVSELSYAQWRRTESEM